MEENISVVVRVRPLQPREIQRGETACVTPGNSLREIQIHTGPQDAQAYACNRFFPSSTTQEEFFVDSGIPRLLDSVIGGFHACSFAFGQTGAGKTYTCTGPTQSIRLNSDGDGVMGRSLQYLFAKLASIGVQFTLKMACMEIYHENVYDLSLPERSKTALNIREHPEKGFFAEGCRQVQVKSVGEAVHTLDHAIKLRHTGSHEMNARSNRSHFMTEFFLELSGDSVDAANQNKGATGIFGDLKSKLDGDQDFDLLGKMTFIDLAGSERLKATKSTGQMQSDTGFINKSLYVLGKVIAGLVRGASDSNIEVPFRESKLTKLLISSLGGKCRTLLISCVSEASGSIHETLRTLKFSMSAAKIKNRPVRFLDPQEKLILDLRDEIKRLKEENKFLIVSLMANPPPIEGPKPSTGGVSPPSQQHIPNQQYSQTDGLSRPSDFNTNHQYVGDAPSGVAARSEIPINRGVAPPNAVRHKALKKLNANKAKEKKKPSPYLHGNSVEAQELYARMSGKSGSSNRLPQQRPALSGNEAPSLLQQLSYQQAAIAQDRANPMQSLRDKLAILKFELEEKRQFMEDNPGTVTHQHEVQLDDLEREVKEMHLELKAVSSLESLNTNSSGDKGFPVSKSDYPLPKFDKEKPIVPSYSAYDMSNKKIYDENPPKKAGLAPIPSSAAPMTGMGLTEEELALVHRKQHLDAYISGKKQLDSLPPNRKSKSGTKSKSEQKAQKNLTPIESKPAGKGFNSSQARALNYPGRKKDLDTQKEHSEKPAVPSLPKAKKPVAKAEEPPQPLITMPVHSRMKADAKPLVKRPTVIGNAGDDSVFGINSSFDSRFENMLKNVASPISPSIDPYGVKSMSPITSVRSVSVEQPNSQDSSSAQMNERAVQPTSDIATDSQINNNNNNIENEVATAGGEAPENDDDEYADEGFEDAYDDEEFED